MANVQRAKPEAEAAEALSLVQSNDRGHHPRFARVHVALPADAPNDLGQVMWRLRKGDETAAVCLFEPMGQGFVWVEVLGSDGDRVMREQRICERPTDIGPAVEEFKTKYLNDGWIETH